ncbi:hypothetical protein ACJX0J_035681, partial [Zea mays]
LSWSVDERSLTDAFSSFGTVTEVRIMYDKNSGRSRGFGFVHFSNDNEAKCAKDAMDGKVQPYCFENMSVIAVGNEAWTGINSTGNARAAIANKFCPWKSSWRISYCSSTFYAGEM